jgi:hypothetical protein
VAEVAVITSASNAANLVTCLASARNHEEVVDREVTTSASTAEAMATCLASAPNRTGGPAVAANNGGCAMGADSRVTRGITVPKREAVVVEPIVGAHREARDTVGADREARDTLVVVAAAVTAVEHRELLAVQVDIELTTRAAVGHRHLKDQITQA